MLQAVQRNHEADGTDEDVDQEVENAAAKMGNNTDGGDNTTNRTRCDIANDENANDEGNTKITSGHEVNGDPVCHNDGAGHGNTSHPTSEAASTAACPIANAMDGVSPSPGLATGKDSSPGWQFWKRGGQTCTCLGEDVESAGNLFKN